MIYDQIELFNGIAQHEPTPKKENKKWANIESDLFEVRFSIKSQSTL